MTKIKRVCKKLIVGILNAALSLTIISPVTLFAANHPFTDIPAGSWYEQDAADCYANGIFTGKNPSTFAPYDSLQIAEALTLAARIHAMKHNKTIPATTTVWYEPYVDYLYDNNLIDTYRGYEGRVGEAVSRADMIHILYRTCDQSDYAAINTIQDDSIPDVVTGGLTGDEIYTFYRAGILNGSADTHYFKPGRTIQRAEVAAIVNRMLNPARRTRFSLFQKPAPDLNAPITEENILALLDSQDPNGYFILTHNHDQQQVSSPSTVLDWFTQGNTILDGIDTCVHEENHRYTSMNVEFNYNTGAFQRYNRYYIGAGEFIVVPETPCFPSSEIYNTIDPAFREKFFRLDLYLGITGQVNLHSVVSGPYGLMNEWNSYCWGLNNDLRMIHYAAGYNFFSQDGGNCLAFGEFGFMILHYLLYASQHHPDVYAGIMNNAAFKQAFNTIFKNYRTLVEETINRDDIQVIDQENLMAILNVLDQPQYMAIYNQLSS